MDPAKKSTIADALKGSIDAIFGSGTSAPATASAAVPSATFRYGTLAVTVPAPALDGKSIGDVFEENAGALGGVTIGENTSIRDTDASSGGVVAVDDIPQVGHIYVASIRKDVKGS